MSRATRLVVVSAGLSVPSSTRLLADRLAGATVEALGQGGEGPVEVTVVELRPLAHALADRLLTGFAGDELGAAIDAVGGADALIVVTPVFAASYSGLFKTFFDVLEPDLLEGTPVLVAATAGTPRHSLVLDHALRPLFGYLRAVVVPTGVFAASEDFGSPGLQERVERAAGQLAGLVSPRRGLRAVPQRRDELVDPLPFAERLRAAGQLPGG
ncbi:FMN reductase [Nocardioides sp. P86]|uniref:FMN reductase n=1 Tax=Nocardioides sp. P86 TaxID=2939569 RepID=UPI002040CD4C|nr:FMN reductase [Nocardioides sp. P86]MCM3515332.1 FMN reductase [Nocardioides sp. P86]